nr:hypothetical protein GCM10020093_023060 [Planobispora longispora]
MAAAERGGAEPHNSSVISWNGTAPFGLMSNSEARVRCLGGPTASTPPSARMTSTPSTPNSNDAAVFDMIPVHPVEGPTAAAHDLHSDRAPGQRPGQQQDNDRTLCIGRRVERLYRQVQFHSP